MRGSMHEASMHEGSMHERSVDEGVRLVRASN